MKLWLRVLSVAMLCGSSIILADEVAVVSVSSPTLPTRINELGYWKTLQQKRPDLLKKADTCYDALVLKPAFRQELLSSRKPAAALEQKKYTADQQKNDAAWVQEHQHALIAAGKARLDELNAKNGNELALNLKEPNGANYRAAMKGFPWSPAGYKLEDFVGYGVGNPKFFQHEGLVFKVFFEFIDPPALTPDLYKKFTEKLASVGFVGDSKIPMGPGQVRFQYNNVIVHAVSVDAGLKAEAAGREIFGASLVHLARGLDVKRASIAGGQALDWHHFLCTGHYSILPPDAKNWAEYLGD